MGSIPVLLSRSFYAVGQFHWLTNTWRPSLVASFPCVQRSWTSDNVAEVLPWLTKSWLCSDSAVIQLRISIDTDPYFSVLQNLELRLRLGVFERAQIHLARSSAYALYLRIIVHVQSSISYSLYPLIQLCVATLKRANSIMQRSWQSLKTETKAEII